MSEPLIERLGKAICQEFFFAGLLDNLKCGEARAICDRAAASCILIMAEENISDDKKESKP